MRYRYRYSLVGARAAGVELHPQRDILLIAPDATHIEPIALAECWLFVADTLAQIPSYVEVIGGLSTKEEALAHATGLQVCPQCKEWVPIEWTDFECRGLGRHDVGASSQPTRVERGFRQATVNLVAVVVLLVLVLSALGVIVWLEGCRGLRI